MFFRDLLKHWWISLSIFNKKDLVLILLASLNALRRSLLDLIKNFWWLLLLLLFFLKNNLSWIVNNSLYEPSILKWIFALDSMPGLRALMPGLGFLIFGLALSFVSFLVVRPSIENKDLFYFWGYANRFFGYLIIAFFISGIPLVPIFWFVAFFFFDSRGTALSLLYSILNGVKLVLYYFPAVFILGLSKGVLDYLIASFMKIVECGVVSLFGEKKIFLIFWDKLFYIVLYLLWLFFLCVMSIYYIRVKHKEFHLFENK